MTFFTRTFQKCLRHGLLNIYRYLAGHAYVINIEAVSAYYNIVMKIIAYILLIFNSATF